MRTFLKKKLIWIIAAAVALALCLSVTAYVRGHSGSLLADSAKEALDPLESAVAAAAGWLEDVYGYMYEYDTLRAENASLRVRVSQLEEELRLADSVIEENERLHTLLKLQQRRRDFSFETARVISWGASNWSSNFTISKGRGAGLELGDCVVTEDGCFVGQIIELTKDSAVVRTLIDPEIRVGAIVERSGAAGLAQGAFAQMTSGCFQLSYLPAGSQLLTGDQILTAGSETVPSGLVLGQVITVETDPGGIRSYAVVEPAADLYRLTQVFIIKDFEISD